MEITAEEGWGSPRGCALQPGPLQLLAQGRGNGQEPAFPSNLFSRSPGILPRLAVRASSLYEAASFPGSPLPLPFPTRAHTHFIYLFITLRLAPGRLSSSAGA